MTRIVLGTVQVRDSDDEQLVRLPTGDGMALVFRHSAEEPARCALEVSEALRKGSVQRAANKVRVGLRNLERAVELDPSIRPQPCREGVVCRYFSVIYCTGCRVITASGVAQERDFRL